MQILENVYSKIQNMNLKLLINVANSNALNEYAKMSKMPMQKTLKLHCYMCRFDISARLKYNPVSHFIKKKKKCLLARWSRFQIGAS